jgi:formate hydrogenlyase transcriptional activator
MTDLNDDVEKAKQLSHFAVERSSDPIYWMDSEARIVRVNEAACKSLDYLREELLSLSFYDINPGFQKEDWAKLWSRLKEQKALQLDSTLTRKDGTTFPVEIRANFIEFEGVEYFYGFVCDMTERNRTAESLRKSESNLAEAQRLAHLGSWEWDIGTNDLYWSDEIYRIFGLSPLKFGATYEAFLASVHPDDREHVERSVNVALNEKEPYDIEHRIVLPNGEIRFVNERAEVTFNKRGEPARMIGTVQDITERKRVEEALRNALEEVERLKVRLQAENVYLQEEIKIDHNFDEIISRNQALKNVLRKVEQVASTDATVLILGETGTGKELLARAIHNISNRRNRPLVKINCAALPANLIESELFGHEKGAFTGALSDKIGRFELADEGTVFLDEIGDLPLELQSKLLRILQDGEFERVGNPATIKVDVRVIAATNRKLVEAIKNNEFREDLYYRLNVFPINMPPLRERKEDIPILVNHFVRRYSANIGKKIDTIPRESMEILQSYDWPGNVRELENVIERAVILTNDSVLRIDDFAPNRPPDESRKFDDTGKLHEVEKRHILDTLEECNWVIGGRRGAAARLGLPASTLRDRMKKLGIKKPD